ncbi:4a-hydroxytetrahydrobiopterin dehydratase [Gilvimarinus algae]|uniref:Putative pterin-4-alpha-carbinolamine dehydratase n=1 Tax=Gilvimarinus algae TaxID=3058037 RepID=A0ABT8THT8_9GAMM|nr:4a-hydroxytetrahydrobiopterin dehydratase [Gilvimarinus sp. SDUM040014]MDO3381867.1 4a-hydroxytetrahydrobiopterin dehydratase [Gilvimarinus sp. SDUM040014]
MSELQKQQCEACNADAPRLSEQEIQTYLQQVPGWQVKDHDGVAILTRQYTFKNFAEALSFTQKVGELAESYQHHPALVTEWGKVTVDWWTHKIKGLHRNDFIMAAKTDGLGG